MQNYIIKSRKLKFLIIIFAFFIFNSAIAEANTYYVSKSGSDSNACTANDQTKTKLTITAGIACLASGDTLFIKAGTYNEHIQGYLNFFPGQSGTDWSHATTIQGYNNDFVYLSGGGVGFTTPLPGEEYKYIIIRNLHFSGGGSLGGGSNGGTTHHIRYEGLELHGENCPGCNGLIAGIDSAQIVNNVIHNNGKALDISSGYAAQAGYGIYISGLNLLIEGNDIYDNGGYGIHLYPGPSNGAIIRNNKIHDNGQMAGATNPYGGIVAGTGDNIQIYNNIIYSNHRPGYGIILFSNNTRTKIYNNTFYGNDNAAILIDGTTISGEVVRNNIFYNNGSNGILGGSAVTQSNNLTTDPKFTDPSSNNFHLQSTSPAINAGATLSEVITDFDGTTRPQGPAYDIGAYEYISGGSTQTLLGDINGDKIVNSLDWSLMSAKWLTSDISADLNKDGLVNSLDWSVMSGNWLKTI